jgi:hypothetical protein
MRSPPRGPRCAWTCSRPCSPGWVPRSPTWRTTALPILRTGLHGVADDLNIGIKSALATLQGMGPQFATIFGNITVAGQNRWRAP